MTAKTPSRRSRRPAGVEASTHHPNGADFEALLDAARRTPDDQLISAEVLDRRRPLTPAEIAAADAYLDAQDAVEAAEGNRAASSDG